MSADMKVLSETAEIAAAAALNERAETLTRTAASFGEWSKMTTRSDAARQYGARAEKDYMAAAEQLRALAKAIRRGAFAEPQP